MVFSKIALGDIENTELREPLTLYRYIKAKMTSSHGVMNMEFLP